MALTDDGCLHSAAGLDARSPCTEDWTTVGPAGQNRPWEFVTRALQPRTFLIAGARSFGLFDIRAKRVEELIKLDPAHHSTAHERDPWIGPTTALQHHQDSNLPYLFARATTVR